ncbi:MAG: pentapeptide repeat-containing protein [Tateyamaria sp.]
MKSFFAWIGFRSDIRYTDFKAVGVFVGFLLMLVTFALATTFAVSFGLLLSALLGFGPYSNDDTGAAVRNLGLVVAAIVGLPLVVWRSIVAQKNSFTAEQAQITDRINKAVQGLGTEKIVKVIVRKPRYKKTEDGDWERDKDGNPVPALRPDSEPLIDREQYEETQPNIEVRVGAILSLERIARDSIRDFDHILGILATYVRENAGFRNSASDASDIRTKVREDIQAAVNVISNSKGLWETSAPNNERTFCPDFSNVNFNGLDARQSNLTFVILEGSSWVNADLGFSNLKGAQARSGCDFSGADLECCNFDYADLNGVKLSRDTTLAEASFRSAMLRNITFLASDSSHNSFEGAMVMECSFFGVSISGSCFKNAYLNNTSFMSAGLFNVDFTGAKNWEQSQFDYAFGIVAGVGQTLLPEGAIYPEHWIDLSELGDEYDPHATYEYAYQEWRRTHRPSVWKTLTTIGFEDDNS